MKKIIVAILVLGIMGIFYVKSCSAEEKSPYFVGMGMMFGSQWKSDQLWHFTPHYYKEFIFTPIVGKHMDDRWDIWLEGKIGYLDWTKDHADALKVGANIMTSYDVLKLRIWSKTWSIYGEAGVGVGYRTYSPSNHTLGNGILGFIDYGAGVKTNLTAKYILKTGLRFGHTSSVPDTKDTGINTYMWNTAVIW